MINILKIFTKFWFNPFNRITTDNNGDGDGDEITELFFIHDMCI